MPPFCEKHQQWWSRPRAVGAELRCEACAKDAHEARHGLPPPPETPAQRDFRLRGEYGLLQESLALNHVLLDRLLECEPDAVLAQRYVVMQQRIGAVRAVVQV